MKRLKEVPNNAPKNVTNALYVGSTAELQKLLKKDKEIIMNLSFITADLLNNISWEDGIIYIILGLIVYAVIRYINKKI